MFMYARCVLTRSFPTSHTQATRKLVLDKMLRKSMSTAAREGAWAFERNIILQQMAENYKDAIEKHKDPAFLKRHLQNPEGAGRNLLSIFCCNYYLVKIIAEPFLNTSRGVQDLVDNTHECMQMSRSRLSCTELCVSATIATAAAQAESNSKDLEAGVESKYEKPGKFRFLGAWGSFFFSSRVMMFLWKFFYIAALALSIGFIMLFIYAAFTV
jgi:hypothetical protein